MSCAHPIPALDLGTKINASGEVVRNIKLLDMKHKHFGFGIEELKEKYGSQLLLLPCGHCYSCGIDYSRMWSSRIMLEAQRHPCSSFITLTYDDLHNPGFLSKRDIQLFLKRLRKTVGKIRYFLCGEYGEGKGERAGCNPHFHCIIFGYDFPDRIPLQKSASGYIIYRSPLLESLWSFGISSIGAVTPESAAYVAKYSMKKKMSGNDRGEFVLMSRRPGIGISGYSKDIWLTDKLYLYGKTYRVPRYFEKLAERYLDFEKDVAKSEREARAKTYKSTKFKHRVDREEEALRIDNDLRIYNDCLKRRVI